MNDKSADKILLFIPMYNCEKQIIRVLSKINAEICEFISEIVIVNNRSTDDGEKAVIDYLQENRLSVKLTASEVLIRLHLSTGWRTVLII